MKDASAAAGRAPEGPERTSARPRSFLPGTPIGLHLRVERQLRVTPDRIWYLVNDRQPRWYTRKCWECGNKHSPPTAQSCTYCHAPLTSRRLLMSARWDPASSLEWQAFVHRRLKYPALAMPVALYRYRDQLLSFYAWSGENVLLGEPAPLPAPTLLSIAFQLADALSFLHAHGVVLRRLGASHVLLSEDGTARLFDAEIEKLAGRPVGASTDPTQPPQRDLRDVAAMLAEWTSVQDEDLRRFLKRVQRGIYKTADAFAVGISQFASSRRSIRTLACSASAQSDVGIVRELNEDHWTWRRLTAEIAVFAVADGMGGHDLGDVASALATRTLVRTLQRRLAGEGDAPPPTPAPRELEAILQQAFEAANTAVLAFAGERSQQMGTTLAALLLVRDRVALVGNVGDSRAWLLRAGHLSQITEDHSMVQAMVAAGKIAAEEAASHPRSNVLLNFLGMSAEVEVDLFTIDLQRDDRILLATDGVWTGVPMLEIERIVSDDVDPRRRVRRLLRAANDAGGNDNATALIVDALPPG